MRKTIIALSTVALVAFTQAAVKTETVSVSYDADQARNISNSIFRVFQKLGNKAGNTIERGTEEVVQGICNAYKNTYGKIILDYGKTIAPIYQAYGDLLGELNVNAGCNETCAISCFKPGKVERGMNSEWTLGFRRSCFENTCGCKFNIEAKMNTTQGRLEVDRKAQKLQDAVLNYTKQMKKLENEANQIIDEGIKKFETRVEKLQNDFYSELRTTAINELGCNSGCVNTCTNPLYFEFYEVPTCIAECKCSKLNASLKINEGKFSLSTLAMYADGDVDAWMVFKRNAKF